MWQWMPHLIDQNVPVDISLNRRAAGGIVEFDIGETWICNFLDSDLQLLTRFEPLSVFYSDNSPPELKSQAYNFPSARSWHDVALLLEARGLSRGG